MDAERRQLLFARGCLHPNPVMGGDALSGNSKIRASADHHFFELLDEPADIAAIFGEIYNRVANHLPGTVIGDIATAIRGMKGDAHLFE